MYTKIFDILACSEYMNKMHAAMQQQLLSELPYSGSESVLGTKDLFFVRLRPWYFDIAFFAQRIAEIG